MERNKPHMKEKEFIGLSKPVQISVGQFWWHRWMKYERPYCIIRIEDKRGCSTNTCDSIVPYAVFRKNKQSMCCSLLSSSDWHYLGEKQS